MKRLWGSRAPTALGTHGTIERALVTLEEWRHETAMGKRMDGWVACSTPRKLHRRDPPTGSCSGRYR